MPQGNHPASSDVSYYGPFEKSKLAGGICQGINDIYLDDKYTLERGEAITFLSPYTPLIPDF